MRVFVCPAAYVDLLESEIARVVDEIRRDVYRREHGEPPLIPDMMLQPSRTAAGFAVIGQANDNFVAAVDHAKAKARGERRSA